MRKILALIFVLSLQASASYIQVPAAGATWGSITGTLSNQTDLQAALDAKLSYPSRVYGSANQFLIGDANGTSGSPTVTLSGDLYSGVFLQGYDGSAFQTGAVLVATASANFSDSSRASKVTLRNVRTGTTALVDSMVIDNNGLVTFPQTQGIDQKFYGAADVFIRSSHANGTLASPTQSLINDNLTRYVSRGHDGTNFQEGGSINFIATDNWDGGDTGTNVEVQSTASGTTSELTRIRLDAFGNTQIQNGKLLINTTNNGLLGTLADFVGTAGQLASNGSVWVEYTGTFPATAHNGNYGELQLWTGAGTTDGYELGHVVEMLAGYTGAGWSAASFSANFSAGSAAMDLDNVLGNFAHATIKDGTTEGIAVMGKARLGTKIYGLAGYAVNGSSVNGGVYGYGMRDAAQNSYGGYFKIGTTTTAGASPDAGDAVALIADNGATALPIFKGKANGTTKVTINSAGTIITTAGVAGGVETTGDANSNISAAVWYHGVTALTAARNKTLPAVAGVQDGQIIMVKDESGAAGTFNISVVPSGAENIDGANTAIPITANYGVLRLVKRGSAWWTF